MCFFIHTGELMVLIGNELAKMHMVNIIHGDLTTSNMMLRRKPNASPPAEIVSSHKTLVINVA